MRDMKSFKTRACQICGKEYQPTSGNQKWCAGCNPYLPTGYKLKLCLRCGQEYRPTSGKQKHCLACKREAKAAQNHGYYVGNEDAFMAKTNAGRAARKAARPQEFSQHIAAYARNYRTLHPDPMHIIDARHAAKRRTLGFNPLNSPFPGCEGHHLNQSDVAYIPLELHCSIPHNVWTGKNMEQINALALQWLAQNPPPQSAIYGTASVGLHSVVVGKEDMPHGV